MLINYLYLTDFDFLGRPLGVNTGATDVATGGFGWIGGGATTAAGGGRGAKGSSDSVASIGSTGSSKKYCF